MGRCRSEKMVKRKQNGRRVLFKVIASRFWAKSSPLCPLFYNQMNPESCLHPLVHLHAVPLLPCRPPSCCLWLCSLVPTVHLTLIGRKGAEERKGERPHSTCGKEDPALPPAGAPLQEIRGIEVGDPLCLCSFSSPHFSSSHLEDLPHPLHIPSKACPHDLS